MSRRPAHPLKIVERRHLNAGSPDFKETYHLVLDISETPIEYKVGDCLAIYPHNSTELIKKILQRLPFPGSTNILFEEDTITVEHYLLVHAHLSKVSRSLKERLDCENCTHVLEAFESSHIKDVMPEELPLLFSKQLPRFYSICSSMKEVGKQAHLIVALTKNPSGAATEFGTCSYFLCKEAPLGEPVISAYHHPAPHFFLPESSNVPIIMIGPGTGVAPFRGFMQERAKLSHCSKNWLFFGEKRASHDFFYKQEWSQWQAAGQLKIETAFSRDGEQKIYVQHRLKEHAKEIWEWLTAGAYIYVCGDAKQMAKEVDATLREIAIQEGGLNDREANAYLKLLRSEMRYQRDVY